MFEYIISLIAPHVCLGCRAEGQLLCYSCQESLPFPTMRCPGCGSDSCKKCATVLTNVFAATEYAGLAKDLVHRLKFERAKAGANVMAQIVSRRMPGVAEDILVSFVPTASHRVRLRGYDQTTLMARQLALSCNLSYAPLLLRIGQQRQVGQTRAIRQTQLRHAFVLRAGVQVRDRRILLIDDVLTTGSTLESAANVLYEAGARQVDAAVFAIA